MRFSKNRPRYYLYLSDVVKFRMCERYFVLLQDWRNKGFMPLDDFLENISNTIIGDWLMSGIRLPDEKETIIKKMEKYFNVIESVQNGVSNRGNSALHINTKDMLLNDEVMKDKINYFVDKIIKIEESLYRKRNKVGFHYFNVPAAKIYSTVEADFILYVTGDLIGTTFSRKIPMIYKFLYDNIDFEDEVPNIFYIEYFLYYYIDILTHRFNLRKSDIIFRMLGTDLTIYFRMPVRAKGWDEILYSDLNRIAQLNRNYKKLYESTPPKPGYQCFSCPFYKGCYKFGQKALFSIYPLLSLKKI